MKTLLTILFLLIINLQLTYSQNAKHDSLIIKITDEGTYQLMNQNNDSAIILYTEAIKLDSSQYKLYYFRGLSYLMNYNCLHAVIDTNEWNTHHIYKIIEGFDFRDTAQFDLAIDDFISCIQLQEQSNVQFPDSSYNWIIPANCEMPSDLGTHDGGEIYINPECKLIYLGVLIYMTNNKQKRKEACISWQIVLEYGLKNTKLLIDKYCE